MSPLFHWLAVSAPFSRLLFSQPVHDALTEDGVLSSGDTAAPRLAVAKTAARAAHRRISLYFMEIRPRPASR